MGGKKTYLDGQQDCGIGYCLQCVAEYKLSDMDENRYPAYACTMAPIMGANVVGPTCIHHLTVQPPQAFPLPPSQQQPGRPMRQNVPLPMNERGELLLPDGSPMRARHAR